MSKLKTIIIMLISILLITIGVGGTLLCTTERGLKIGVAIAAHFIPGTLHIEDMSGTLTSTVHLYHVQYTHENISIEIHHADITPQLSDLPYGHIALQSAELNQLYINHQYHIQKLEVAGYLAPHELHLQQLTMHIPLHTITLTGTLALQPPYTTHITGELTTKCTGYSTIHHAISLDGDTNEWMHLQIKTTEPFTAILQAKFKHLAALQQFSITGNWKHVLFPLTPAQNIASKSGTLDISGTPAQYKITLKTDLSGRYIPSGEWNIIGNGKQQNIQLTTIRASTLQGTIQGAWNISWMPTLQWDGKLHFSHINPGVKWPNWIGSINADLQSQGKLTSDNPQFLLLIQNVQGQLQAKPIRAYIHCTLKNKQLNLFNSHIGIGEDFFDIKGHLDTRWKIWWKLNAPSITELLANATGTTYSEGTITGNRATPHLKAYFKTHNLFIEDVHIQTLSSNVDMDLTPHGNFTGKLLGERINIGPYNLRSLQFLLSGTLNKHQLSTQLSTHQEKIEATCTGSYTEDRWLGTLKRFVLTPRKHPAWILQNPTAISISALRDTLAPFVLRSGKASISGEGNYETLTHWKWQLDIHDLPSETLDTLFPKSLDIFTTINGHMHFQNNDDTRLQGEANLSTNACNIVDQDKQKTIGSFDKATLHVLADKKGLSSSVQIQKKQTNILAAQFDLPNYRGDTWPKATQKMHATIQANLSHLNLLPILIPYVDQTDGKLYVNFKVGGILANPTINGSVKIQDGTAQVIPANITLSSINITLHSQHTQDASILATAQSETGKIHISGTASLANWQANGKIHITGENMPVIHTDAYQLNVTPDLSLTYDPPKLTIQGKISIPQANIAPKHFTHVTTLPSHTVIITARQKTQSTAPLETYLDIMLHSQDQTKINIDGLTGNITGKIRIHDTPDTLTTATGSLHINQGKYDIYGSILQIDDGSLIYTGGPIKDPGLNIRASKKVQRYVTIGTTNSSAASLSSTVQDLIVGIQVGGSLNHPKINLFSDPAGLRDADILSYLVLDTASSNASSAQGKLLMKAAQGLGLNKGFSVIGDIQETFGLSELGITTTPTLNLDEDGDNSQNASFIVGKQLTPKLHMSYSVGLLEPINIFKLRYLLSKSWSLQSETSTLDSGADLFYTLETD